METVTSQIASLYSYVCLLYSFGKKAIFSTMFTVSECDLISNTLTSHDSAPIRARPTLKDAEQLPLKSKVLLKSKVPLK
jgi:hypothetical protein